MAIFTRMPGFRQRPTLHRSHADGVEEARSGERKRPLGAGRSLAAIGPQPLAPIDPVSAVVEERRSEDAGRLHARNCRDALPQIFHQRGSSFRRTARTFGFDRHQEHQRVLYSRDDADDQLWLPCFRFLGIEELNQTSECVLSRPQLLREHVGDDRHPLSGAGSQFGVAEITAAKRRKSEDPRVIATDDAEYRAD